MPNIFKKFHFSYKQLIIFGVIFVAFGSFFVWRSLASGTTYYVSPNGNDGLDGLSPQTAWQSINRVNSAPIQQGDTIAFEGGQTFSGKLYFGPGRGGTSSSPVIVTSYGTGRATINGANDSAITIYNVAGINISNLNFVGSGASSNPAAGINAYNDLAGNVQLLHLYLDKLDIKGFKYGISVGGGNGASGFQDVRLTNLASHDNLNEGVKVWGPQFSPSSPNYAHRFIYVGHVQAYNNLGDPNELSTNSGSGIVLGSVRVGMIERSVAWNNGSNCKALTAGPVGIWAYDSTNVTIQNNESYNNRTGGPADGDGFDLDQNTSSSVLQYNYSHDNDGAGYLLWAQPNSDSFNSNNIVRYNLSQNDGRVNNAGIYLGGPIKDDAVYGNTVYIVLGDFGVRTALGEIAAIKVSPLDSSSISNVVVSNNILMSPDGHPLVISPNLKPPNLTFLNNDYYGGNGFSIIRWNGQNLTSLATWRNLSGQELLNGSAKGTNADPQLNNPGGGGTIGNADQLSNVSAYKLKSSSPVFNSGSNLQTLFGLNMGGKDFYGDYVTQGSAPAIGAYEGPQRPQK